MSDYWYWITGFGSQLKSAASQALMFFFDSKGDKDSPFNQNLESIAKGVCDKHSLDPGLEPAIIDALKRLPPIIPALLRSCYCEPSTSPAPTHGNEFLEFLRGSAPEIYVRLFLIILAQVAFRWTCDPTYTFKSLSLLGIKDQVTTELVNSSPGCSRSPCSGQLGVENDLLRLNPPTPLCLSKFQRLGGLESIPGKRIAFIGGGGGSDGVQASILGLLCERAGKRLQFVASIRASRTTSEDAKGQMGLSRTVSNHDGEVSPGVFKMTDASSGSGRFVENVPANDVEMYLVTEAPGKDGLASQVSDLIEITNARGNMKEPLDTIVLVDTGGDILEDPLEETPASKQHQDLRVLSELASPSSALRKAWPRLNVFSAIVAPGIDHPVDSQRKLEAAKAQFYSPNKEERRMILEIYTRWDFTGSESGLQAGKYGKTPLAWQNALRAWDKLEELEYGEDLSKLKLDQMQFHTAVLRLPLDRVMNERNPWNPFVPMQLAMAGILFMDAADLLSAAAPGLV